MRAVCERLLEKLVPDCCSGPDAWRAIALSCLDVLLAREDDAITSAEYVQTLSRRGHLNLFCSLSRFEEPLRACVRDVSAPLNVLFVWESQLSLLIRVAQTPGGVLLLSQAGLLASLVDLSFLDSRPAVTLADRQSGAERYEQALYPVFSLFSALLAPPLNTDVLRHAFEFVTNHSQAVTDILQVGLLVECLCSCIYYFCFLGQRFGPNVVVVEAIACIGRTVCGAFSLV